MSEALKTSPAKLADTAAAAAAIADNSSVTIQQQQQQQQRKPRAFVFPPPNRFVEPIADLLTSPLPASRSPPPSFNDGISFIHHEIDTPSLSKTSLNRLYCELLDVQLFMISFAQFYTPKWIGVCLEMFHWLYQSEAIIAGITILHFADLYGFGDVIATANFGAAMLISEIINGMLKNFVQEPRPFWISDRISNPHNKFERDFSFPSGHSQASSAIAFGFYFVVIQNMANRGQIGSMLPASVRYAFLALLTMTFLTGFSRVYFGMHYPMDVVCGWVVGFFTAQLFAEIFPLGTIIRNLLTSSAFDAYLLAVLLPFVLMVVLGLICWLFPPNWDKLAKCQKIARLSMRVSDKKSLKAMRITPSMWQDYVAYGGILAGILFSVIFCSSTDSYVSAHKSVRIVDAEIWRRICRVLIGFAGMLPAIWLLVNVMRRSGVVAVRVSISFLCYFYLGCWITLFGPEAAAVLGF
eukprot:TRINITY_DN4189_c1_g1_i1.p1 TRINITY_DN4189_c1_g1~~TRINITY_DN4189_c1_g1_i1.p1  ORF type:complete len:494 (+),score=101.60 TRINITY_DN4189_c1_g1_i1:86-1483(+)